LLKKVKDLSNEKRQKGGGAYESITTNKKNSIKMKFELSVLDVPTC